MSTVERQKRYTIQEYLSLEKDSPERHEYYAGEIFAMSGGSLDHGAIAFNWCGELKAALKGKDCRAFTSDVKVRIEAEDAFVYPDVSLVCGEIETYGDNDQVLVNPHLIIEVLSDSTEGYDRGAKFFKYQRIPSLKEYVIASQNSPDVEVFRRTEEGWKVYDHYHGLEVSAHLDTLDAEISMAEIYRSITFNKSK